MIDHRPIIVLDFGGQYAHLIARRVRSLGVMAEIRDPALRASELKDAAGIILSGGPQSVYEEGSPQADPQIFSLGIPVLGICYGLHWMTQTLGGTVKPGTVKEYGHTEITIANGGGKLLRDFGSSATVWMSHGDEAVKLPDGFRVTATSQSCRHVAFEDAARDFFAVQFHPEVVHTEHGTDLLKRFVSLCHATPWILTGYAERIAASIREQVGDRKVFMLVSGGVDSTVAFTLLNQVLGTDRVQGLLVDTGLMRKDEIAEIRVAFDALNVHNLKIEDASEEFFRNLRGVYEPEAKRKIIGDTFLAVQARVSEELGMVVDRDALRLRSGQSPRGDDWMLGQGTIYPDTIETKGTKHADHIKTHHNRVAAVQELIAKGLVIEPLKELYKDEVRVLGEELGLPHALVWRHPFPGPGLGVRILCASAPSTPTLTTSPAPILFPMAGEGLSSKNTTVLPVQSVGVQGDGRTYRHALAVFQDDRFSVSESLRKLATEIPNTSRAINRVLLCTSHTAPVPFVFSPGYLTRERADLLRDADMIVAEEMRSMNLYEVIWQFPVVLLPFGTKAGGQSIVLRPVESEEAMTARAASLPAHVLQKMTERILKLPGIDCVFFDLTSKPPGTIEWE